MSKRTCCRCFAKLRACTFVIGVFLAQIPHRTFADQISPEPSPTSQQQELLLEVTLNDQVTGTTVLFLQDKANSHLYVTEDTLKNWQLVQPEEAPINFMGKNYYDLAWYHGYKSTIDMQQLTITLNFPAQYFQNTALNLYNQGFVTPTKSPFGGYVNYSLFSSGPVPGSNPNGSSTQNSGLFSPTVFGPYGNINSQFLINQGPNINNEESNPLRLQSFYQLDLPSQMQTIIVGDSNTTAGAWGQSVLFGGLTWQTNFGTQPSYTTFPLPTIAGTAVVPSSVQLFNNNVLLNNTKVPPGPFTINNIPTVTGSGTLNVVTTNVFGQEQVTSIPYYTTPQLLKPGLQNFSYQLGFVRDNYGLDSNDYGPLIGVASDRFGVTNNLTLEGDLETMLDQQNTGASLSYLVANSFLFNASGAYSNNTLGQGQLWQAGASRQGSNTNIGVNVTYTTPNYLQIGNSVNEPSAALQLQSFASMSFLQRYSAGISYTEQRFRTEPNFDFASLNLSANLRSNLFLSLNLLTNVGGTSNKSASLSLNMSFGTVYNLGFSSTYVPAQNNTSASVQNTMTFTRALPSGPGYGYTLQAQTMSNQDNNYQGTFSLNTNYADGNIRLASFGNSNAYQATINGAVTYLDGVYASPPVSGSFATVNVPGVPDAKVYYNNQLVGTTNASGNILVPNLASYSNNTIAIDPEQLPLNTDILSTTVQAIPYARSGLPVTFAIKKLMAAAFALKLPNGDFVPTGSMINLNGNAQKSYYVGYNGQTYLDNLVSGKNALIVKWQSGECSAVVNYEGDSDAKNPIVNMGTLVCTPVS